METLLDRRMSYVTSGCPYLRDLDVAEQRFRELWGFYRWAIRETTWNMSLIRNEIRLQIALVRIARGALTGARDVIMDEQTEAR